MLDPIRTVEVEDVGWTLGDGCLVLRWNRPCSVD